MGNVDHRQRVALGQVRRGEHVFDVRQRLVAGPVGSEAVVERHDGPVRHDVARHAPSTNTACRAS